MPSSATTLCTAWRVVRTDQITLGFTDHDEDLTFLNTCFKAQSGFTTAQLESRLGFAVGGTEIAGGFIADILSESDMMAGLYDEAQVEIWSVNWQDPTQHVLLDIAILGEISRHEYGFRAELRSQAHVFDVPYGRFFQTTCSADLGDSKCRVQLEQGLYSTQSTIMDLPDSHTFHTLVQDPLESSWKEGWFREGVLCFLSGANQHVTLSVKAHTRLSPSHHSFTLWTEPPYPLCVGDSFRVTAGCDKRMATCCSQFKNHLNFRGFPRLPSNDILLSYPHDSIVMDGGSLFQPPPSPFPRFPFL